MSRVEENAAQRISQTELAKLVRLPKSMDGIVATLYETKNLRIYGITNLEKSGLSEIHIWGIERFPLPLAVIEESGRVELMADSAYVSVALSAFPELKKLFREKGILPAEQSAEEKYKESEFVYNKINADLNSGRTARTWEDIYAEMYKSRLKDELNYEALHAKKTSREYAINKEPTAPNPPGAEKRSIEFAGWLSASNAPDVVIEKTQVDSGYGLKIHLHSRYRDKLDPSFSTIEQRIILENRFELSWLKLSTLKVIELVEPQRPEGGMILVFNGTLKIPSGLRYYVLNPKTGLRISNKAISS